MCSCQSQAFRIIAQGGKDGVCVDLGLLRSSSLFLKALLSIEFPLLADDLCPEPSADWLVRHLTRMQEKGFCRTQVSLAGSSADGVCPPLGHGRHTIWRPENCSAGGGGGGVTWTPAEGGGGGWRNGVPCRALCFV